MKGLTTAEASWRVTKFMFVMNVHVTAEVHDDDVVRIILMFRRRVPVCSTLDCWRRRAPTWRTSWKRPGTGCLVARQRRRVTRVYWRASVMHIHRPFLRRRRLRLCRRCPPRRRCRRRRLYSPCVWRRHLLYQPHTLISSPDFQLSSRGRYDSNSLYSPCTSRLKIN